VRGALDEMMKRYKGEVRLVYRHLPLQEIHSQAMPAAVASECAGVQGKFWPYHDLIFENRAGLNEATFLSMAKQAGVRNLKKFEACFKSDRFRSLIQEDMKAASALGITGTPGFFIGSMGADGLLEGEILTGARPIESFVEIIEAVRKRRKN
jgi:protein-disulfide isomerase